MYLIVENDKDITCNSIYYNEGENIKSILVSDELYNDWKDNENKYVYYDGQIIVNPNWEQEQAEKRRQQLDNMTLTPADVERALYKAKGMDFEDLQSYIATYMPTVDIKALKIEFRAKDFYRGATLSDGKTRLFDVIGALLNYTPEDMDYLFEHKELPVDEQLISDEEIPF